MKNIGQKVKTSLAVLGGAYILATAYCFNGAISHVDRIENERGVTEAISVNNKLKNNYSNSSLPSKVLKFGHYLGYALNDYHFSKVQVEQSK